MPRRCSFGDEPIEVVERAEERIDVGVIGDVVTEVGHRRGIDRREPDGIDAEPLEVVEPRKNSGQVADAVAVGILKRARIDLVDDAVLPPFMLFGHALMLLASDRTTTCWAWGCVRRPRHHLRSEDGRRLPSCCSRRGHCPARTCRSVHRWFERRPTHVGEELRLGGERGDEPRGSVLLGGVEVAAWLGASGSANGVPTLCLHRL